MRTIFITQKSKDLFDLLNETMSGKYDNEETMMVQIWAHHCNII